MDQKDFDKLYEMHLQYLKDGPGRGKRLVLTGADLGNLVLTEYDLSDAFFDCCKFDGSVIQRTNFNGSYMAGCSFEDVYALGANFTKANLYNASFTEAYLKSANIIECQISKATFVNADLTGANLAKTDFKVEHLSQVKILNAESDGSKPNESKITDVWDNPTAPSQELLDQVHAALEIHGFEQYERGCWYWTDGFNSENNRWVQIELNRPSFAVVNFNFEEELYVSPENLIKVMLETYREEYLGETESVE